MISLNKMPSLLPSKRKKGKEKEKNADVDTIGDGPDANTCLAHLKLLSPLQALKEDVGYTDGLWGL